MLSALWAEPEQVHAVYPMQLDPWFRALKKKQDLVSGVGDAEARDVTSSF